jgi:ATP-binding cassette, subfamily B (MDR/TAP), member 1
VAAASRTTVCVAHRLSTIRNADNIIVLSKGEITEQGTHDELIALKGKYHNLVTAQHISSTAEDNIAEMEVEEEDFKKADQPLDEAMQRIATGSTIERKEIEPKNYSNYQLIRKVHPHS